MRVGVLVDDACRVEVEASERNDGPAFALACFFRLERVAVCPLLLSLVATMRALMAKDTAE